MTLGKIRSPVSVILLSVVTLGIYSLYWQYASFKEMKMSSGEGIGGGLGLLFAILLGVVNIFLLPHEVGQLFSREGRESNDVSVVTGFWVLIPFVGWIIWVVKAQGQLNRYWGGPRERSLRDDGPLGTPIKRRPSSRPLGRQPFAGRADGWGRLAPAFLRFIPGAPPLSGTVGWCPGHGSHHARHRCTLLEGFLGTPYQLTGDVRIGEGLEPSQ